MQTRRRWRKPKVSVLIATLNEEKKIERLLQNLRSNPVPLEIIVIDGGSTDRTVEIAKMYGARIIHQLTKGGPAEAWNMGARTAKTSLINIMGGDFRGVNNEFFSAMLPHFKDPLVAAVTPAYTFAPVDTFFESLYLRSQYFYYQNYHGPFHSSLSYTGVIRKHVFNVLGGLEKLGVGEDIEFEKRIKKYFDAHGLRSEYEPRALQLSNVPETWGEFVRSALWYGRTSITYFKNTKSTRFFRQPLLFLSFLALLSAVVSPAPFNIVLAIIGIPAAFLFLWFLHATIRTRDAWYIPAYFLRILQGGLYWIGMTQSLWFKGLSRG